MGKVKRLRQKLHIAAKKEKQQQQQITENLTNQEIPDAPITLPSDNLFAGLNINLDTLKTKLNDDVRSVKSFKSLKSEKSGHHIIPKKEKLKMRREMLMRKIDVVNQMKKDQKVREKRKNTALIGDTNPLHDALPSLESLLKHRPTVKQNITAPKKKKGIEKAKKRRKELVQGVKMYKSVLNNKTFKKNPLGAVTQVIQTLVAQGKQKLK